jgi:hypothetical protein
MLNDIVSEGRGETDLLPCRKKKKKRVKENITNNNGGPRAAPTKPI